MEFLKIRFERNWSFENLFEGDILKIKFGIVAFLENYF